jgi:rare lipoprotein A
MAAAAWAVLAAPCAQAASALPSTSAASSAAPARHLVRQEKPRLDRSGRQRTGKASIYAKKFDGRKMADGMRMDPQDDNAASKTLPLGTTARVTNTETGRSAIVTIRDRGPHVPGRIVDLSPATAEKVGLDRHEGVAKVVVKPISLPPAAGASEARGASPDAKRDARGTGSPESR